MPAEIPNLPNLKKQEKEKERKKGGAWWRFGSGESPWTGAMGGASRVAASAAAWEAALEGGAGIFSTLAGKLGAALAALLLAGAGVMAYKHYHAESPQASAARGALGGITDSLKIRGDGGGNQRMEIANGREVHFEESVPAAEPAKTDAAKTEPDQQTADKNADADQQDAQNQNKDRLAHDLSGAKLSSSLGGEFGSKNIFAGGNSTAPQFDQGLSKLKAKSGHLSAARGGLGARAGAHSVLKGHTVKSLGQLHLANRMSVSAARTASATGAAQTAIGAFDQQQSIGGQLSPITGPGDKSPPPDPNPNPNPNPGPNPTPNPDCSSGQVVAADGTCQTPPDPHPNPNPDPNLTNELNHAGDLANQAGALMKQSQIFMMLGLAMIVAGAVLVSSIVGTAWGWALIAAGLAMIMMAMGMQSEAAQKAKQAMQIGQQVAQQVGPEQGNIVNYCTNKALGGTPVQNCNPPTSVTQENTVEQENKSALQRQEENKKPGPIAVGGTPISDN